MEESIKVESVVFPERPKLPTSWLIDIRGGFPHHNFEAQVRLAEDYSKFRDRLEYGVCSR